MPSYVGGSLVPPHLYAVLSRESQTEDHPIKEQEAVNLHDGDRKFSSLVVSLSRSGCVVPLPNGLSVSWRK